MTQEPSPPKTYLPPIPVRVLRQGVNVPQRQALALAGLAMIGLSVPVGFATPSVPLGLPMAAVGGVLFWLNAVWARSWLAERLQRHPRIETRLPAWFIRAALQRDKRTPDV
jgi:hypothetical protein